MKLRYNLILLILMSVQRALGQSDGDEWELKCKNIVEFERVNEVHMDSVLRFRFIHSDRYLSITGVHYFISGFNNYIEFKFKTPIQLKGDRLKFENNGDWTKIPRKVKKRKVKKIEFFTDGWSDYRLKN